MKINLKKIPKKIFYWLVLIIYDLLVKVVHSDRKTLPKRFVRDLYEVYPSPDLIGPLTKIVMPYVEVDSFNRHDLNRPYEVLHIDLLKPDTFSKIQLLPTCDFILPIALLDKSGDDDNPKSIQLNQGDKNTSIYLKFKNRFHYLPIKAKTEINSISIKSTHDLIAIGAPIYRDISLNLNKPKLIVHIFVDALSQILIDSCAEDIMPVTKSFFDDGITFTNAYSQADWTLSSMSGVFTGKYTKDHLIYHPRNGDRIKDLTLAEVLSDSGYKTSLISAVPKLTPVNGFDKGFSRCVVAPFKDANYIINEAIEQLDAFGGNQYLFLGLFDVHESYTLQPISSQVKNRVSDFNYKSINSSKNLTKLYDGERLAMCANTLTHLDSKLERLFDKIKDYDKDAVVLLHSDHGVDFITKNSQRLSNEREKVALMIKGGNLGPVNNKEIREIRSVPSMILAASNIKDKMKYVKPSFTITESLYPNQEYELAIRDNRHVLFFQVPWTDLYKRQISDYQYRATLHNVNNELEEIEDTESFKTMLGVAKAHYSELINNLIAFESH